MSEVKNLAEVSVEEQRKFIQSFDTVLSDLDGVIWLKFVPIPGAFACMKNLRKQDKKIHYVSNNGLTSAEYIFESLCKGDVDLTSDDLVVPSETMVYYLKKINFKKEIFPICMDHMKNRLEKNGFKLAPELPTTVDENVDAVLSHNDRNANIGAVVMDNDFNINYLKLQKAFWYLRNPDCLFLVTQGDKSAPFGPNGPLIGVYYFAEALKDLTGRDYIQLGKPSQICVDYIKEKFDITNPRRVLFIGDSIHSDMHTGTLGGFQKLLVLSGTEKLEDVLNWKYPEEFRPTYYVQDLNVFNEIILSVCKF